MRFLILVFPLLVQAAPQNPPSNIDQYRWLYEVLFNNADRIAQPNETHKSFYVHMLDSEQSFPHPEQIEKKNLKLIEKVQGLITYVNVIKKKYAYEILSTSEGVYILRVKVHFKDPNNNDMNQFREKFKTAENLWNSERVLTDFDYRFKFEVAEIESEADFSVNVVDSTRGPYDRIWGRNWSANTIAHELGHMLGLGDEYQTLSGQIDCFKSSLMCDSRSGKAMPHHYYFILRRLIQTHTERY